MSPPTATRPATAAAAKQNTENRIVMGPRKAKAALIHIKEAIAVSIASENMADAAAMVLR
jgi:hypothetical protein